MKLIKIGNRFINLKAVAYISFVQDEAHIYFSTHGEGALLSQLILRDDDARQLQTMLGEHELNLIEH